MREKPDLQMNICGSMCCLVCLEPLMNIFNTITDCRRVWLLVWLGLRALFEHLLHHLIIWPNEIQVVRCLRSKPGCLNNVASILLTASEEEYFLCRRLDLQSNLNVYKADFIFLSSRDFSYGKWVNEFLCPCQEYPTYIKMSPHTDVLWIFLLDMPSKNISC